MIPKPLNPASLSKEEILVGPGRNYSEAITDLCSSKRLPEILEEHNDERFVSPAWASDCADGFTLAETTSGFCALDKNQIVGATIGAYTAVDSAYRRKGLGLDLILERLIRHRQLPTWKHDTPSYTTAGATLVEQAHRQVRTRPELFATKAARTWAQHLRSTSTPIQDVQAIFDWASGQGDGARTAFKKLSDSSLPRSVHKKIKEDFEGSLKQREKKI